MDEKVREKPRKRPYDRPVLRQIALRPEEAVLAACKTSDSAGPSASTCTSLSCSSILS